MLRVLLLLGVMCMATPSLSISCVTYYRYSDQAIGNCSGDACVAYIYSESVIMLGCATNVLFSNRTGCYDDGKGNVICSCQSDNCNSYALDEQVQVDFAPKMSCFGHTASMCKGLACAVERVDNETSDACGILAASLSLVELQANLIVLEQTTKEAYNEDDGMYFSFLGRDFRANCMTTKCVQHAQKLRTEGFKSKKPQVQCHSYVVDNYNILTCQGDFCYYETVDGAVNRGCLTIEDSLAERKLTVGIYGYFMQRTYLCNEDFCNENEGSARDNVSPDMGRLFTWPPLETFETTTNGVSHIVPISLALIIGAYEMLVSV